MQQLPVEWEGLKSATGNENPISDVSLPIELLFAAVDICGKMKKSRNFCTLPKVENPPVLL